MQPDIISCMEKLRTSIVINAPVEKVWNTMLEKDTYEQWTKPFNPTSTFRGDWSEGSKMLFIGTDEQGKDAGGMVSRIAENRPHEYISIEHLGIISNGVEDTESEEATKWAPAHENYAFTEKDGGTEVSIELDINEAEKEVFEEMWAKALAALKELAEK